MAAAGTTHYEVPGLAARVEILIDAYGVPHIYAEDSADLYFAQGFNAARDRLFQIDLGRRRGLGLLSEVYGSDYLERDRAARLFLYRGDLDQEWNAYGEDVRSVCTSFAAGINAFIDLTESAPELLAPEFALLGYGPSRWAAEDLVRIRHHGVYTNLAEEVLRARTLRDFGTEVEDLRAMREPNLPVTVPAGLDLSVIERGVLDTYRLATTAPSFSGEPPAEHPERGLDGSNNWVLAGSRTGTGRPILCNDPHRDTTSLPGLSYLAHLSCPEFDAIGAGEPHLPGISIGHNGMIGFGFTIFMIDQEDLYMYALNPDNPLEYRYGDGWRTLEVEVEAIPVQDGGATKVELLFSGHGPIVAIDLERNVAFAVRAAWLQAGMVPYLGSIGYMVASNWDEFLGALDTWGAPGENLIYADVDGNIGCKPAGRVPRRPNWDGALPVPGDGRYEWDGEHPVRDLPAEFNPSRGWIATANHYPLPEEHPLADRVGYLWAPPERKQRIDEMLAEAPGVTVDEVFAMQYDTMSIPARRILDAVRELPYPDRHGIRGLDELLAWDARVDADSRAAAIYEIWMRRHFRPAVLARAVRQLGRDDVDVVLAHLAEGASLVDDRVLYDLLEDPVNRLGDDADQFLANTVASTLGDAFAELEELLGNDTSRWTWGALSHTRADHPLRDRLAEATDPAHLTTGTLPRSGSGQTVQLAHYDSEFRQVRGSTFRMVLDVGEWDNSVAMTAPGQSGDWRSPHQQDLFEPWVTGESFPLLYTRARVDEAAVARILLDPVVRGA